MQDSMALVNEELERYLEHMDLQEVERKAGVASLKNEIDEMSSQAWLSLGPRVNEGFHNLTKKWSYEEHPLLDLLELKCFMARQRTGQTIPEEIALKGFRDDAFRDSDVGSPSA
ncbi:hypothetical protein Adt_05843 [Abeliophyllum distichum]|uniref:Uncharacterized protein n=1 Tax=Abeliophyllum distichum TaxID=126358 RepID=A0ABD1V5I0_9LAMI